MVLSPYAMDPVQFAFSREDTMDELLKILKRNAREKPEDIARMLGVSADQVRSRIAEYEKAGVIRGYQAIVNEDQLDIDLVTAVIEGRQQSTIIRSASVSRLQK